MSANADGAPDMLGSIEFLASAGVIFTLGKLSQIMRDLAKFFWICFNPAFRKIKVDSIESYIKISN